MFQKEVELVEYQPVMVSEDSLSYELGEYIWKNYSNQVTIDFPSPKTDGRWRLQNLGWVGYIPVSNEFMIYLKPKVPLENIFRMLEYAYNLKSIHFFSDQVQCDTLQDFFNILAGILARRILNRGRKGFYKAYRDEYERLPYICGRIDLNQQIKTPWSVKFSCHYQECTQNIADNQILLWTLYVIKSSGLCVEETLHLINRAFRSLRKAVDLRPFTPQQCYKRSYNRLNLDYQPLHNLCWFFLEHCGPQFAMGKQAMIPFMVNMAFLYELFVDQWLKVHLPEGLELREQERVDIDESSMLYFIVDLVIYEKDRDKAIYVLDTKYKVSDSISPSDFSQVTTYALAKNCQEAILIYPGEINFQSGGLIQDIRVRSISFPLEGDIEKAGRSFLKDLLGVEPEMGKTSVSGEDSSDIEVRKIE